MATILTNHDRRAWFCQACPTPSPNAATHLHLIGVPQRPDSFARTFRRVHAG